MFNLQDSVQLLHGYTPTMTISEIKEEQALCVWWDSKTKKMHKEWLPLNVLKPTPEKPKLSLEEIKRATGYR